MSRLAFVRGLPQAPFASRGEHHARAPFSAKSLALAWPMPLEAPVTTTTEFPMLRGIRFTPSSRSSLNAAHSPTEGPAAESSPRARPSDRTINCQQARQEAATVHAHQRRCALGDHRGERVKNHAFDVRAGPA